MPSLTPTPLFQKLTQQIYKKALSKASPPVNIAAKKVLQRRFQLAQNDGIWGESDAAAQLGYRGYTDDVDLMPQIINDFIESVSKLHAQHYGLNE